tara:strand:+ start:2154 stop:5513 length:3360 start_codon:yes stop_codon:yes gene_type:complete
MIYLHKNGVTIVADKKARTGQAYELNGQKYLVVDRKMLERMVDSGEDVTKVVTTRVKMMLWLFQHKTNFNQDISSWDVSNVNSMAFMFASARKFNQDISNWDVGNVDQMESMFEGASSFNCDISNWKITSYNNLRKMFAGALSFNQPIGKWNVRDYCDISYMFLNAKSFNQDLNNWNVKKVRSMISLFEGAESFNQDLDSWDLEENNYRGLSLNRLFKNAKKFNGNISTWKFNIATRMDEMFAGASSFNQDISVWDVSKVEKMDKLFNGAESFNQDLSGWNIHDKLKIKTPTSIFTGAKNFNPAHSPFQKKKRSIDTSTKNLTSEDKKTFSKIKKLLLSRDVDKIDLAIELFRSLNNTELFNTLLDGCKLETIDSSEPNHFESKLRTNKIFTGTGPAQPLLNYALMNIIASVPEDIDIKIHESIIIKNINRLNISTILEFNYNSDKFNHFFEIDKFTHVKKIIIDFENFKNINFDVNFKNKSVKNIIAKNFNRSLKWLENFKQIEDLYLSFESYNANIENFECFDVLRNLEKLELDCNGVISNVDFLSNCENLKSLILHRTTNYSSKINLNNIEALSRLKSLEILEITHIDEQLDLSIIDKCLMIKELSLDIKDTFIIKHLIGCESLKIFNLKIDSSLDVTGIDFSSLNVCKNLESINISGGYSYNFNGKIKSINGVNILGNIKKVELDEFAIVVDNHDDLINTTNEVTVYDSSNIKINVEKKPDLNIAIKDTKLSSGDKKTFTKIKKLLLSRDINKIDLGVELLTSLNSPDLFNILLDGCMLETKNGSEPNYFESKLHTNKVFTGTGPAQPFLNYAIMNIIASLPQNQNINIHESLMLKNITCLNISSVISSENNPSLDGMFNVENFTHLHKVIIDFSKFGKVNFIDYLKSSTVKEITAMRVEGSLKWLINFKHLKILKLSPFGYDRVKDHEVFNSLVNLEALEIKCSNDITFLKNCIKIRKLKLDISDAESTINIDALECLSTLEELEIIDTTTTKQEMQTFDTGVLLTCKKLNKLIYRTKIKIIWGDDDDSILIAKTIKRRLHQVENVLKKISLNQKLECLSIFTLNDNKWSSGRARGEKGVLLHLSVQILSFNGLKISPNLKAININEIELLLNN